MIAAFLLDQWKQYAAAFGGGVLFVLLVSFFRKS
jgi:hypothetical protein